jgi:hypothetical protein
MTKSVSYDEKLLSWPTFRGKNTKVDALDIDDTQALEVTNLKIAYQIGKLIKAYGHTEATLKGVQFVATGLPAGSINAIAEVIASDADSDSPYYIAQAGSSSKFYLWNESTPGWDEITDFSTTVDTTKVIFLQRDNGIVAAVGSGSTNVPVFFSFKAERFSHAFNDGAKTEYPIAAAFGGSTAAVKNPDDLTGVSLVVTQSIWNYSGPPTGYADFFYKDYANYTYIGFKIALQFDDAQWGPPSETTYTTTVYSGIQARISVEIKIAAATFDKRVTAVKVYRCTNYTGKSTDVFRLFRYVRVNQEASRLGGEATEYGGPTINVSGTKHKCTKSGSIFTFDDNAAYLGNNDYKSMFLAVKTTTFTVGDSVLDYFTYLLPISSALRLIGTDTIQVLLDASLADGTYYVDIYQGWLYYGGYYYYGLMDYAENLDDAVEMWEDLGFVPDEVYSLNYEVAVQINKRQFVARFHDGDRYYGDVIAASYVSHSGGYAYDTFHAEDRFSVRSLGITEIMGLGKWQNRLVIFGRESVAVLSIGAGSSLTWQLDDTFQTYGMAAIKSLQIANGANFFISNAGPAFFRNMQTTLLPQLESQDNWPLDVTTLSEAVAGYDDQQHEVLFSFPTDDLIICFNLLTDEWTQLDGVGRPTQFLLTNDRRVLFTDGSAIYEFSDDATQFGSTDIVPYYKSRTVRIPGYLLAPVAYEIRYNSDTEVSLSLLLDGAEVTLPDQGLEAGDRHVENFLPAGLLADKLNFVLTLTSANAADNTTFEISEFNLKLKLVRAR